MVYNKRRRGLFRFQQEPGGEAHADRLFRMKQRKELGLVLEVRTRRIAERRINRSGRSSSSKTRIGVASAFFESLSIRNIVFGDDHRTERAVNTNRCNDLRQMRQDCF